MSFVVEDGTSKTNSNSYSSTTAATTYWTDHGNPTEWSSASTAKKQEGLRIGTQYLDATYHSRWKGYVTDVDQALDWPRTGVSKNEIDSYDSDEMPVTLLEATAELALRHLKGIDLIPDISTPGTIKRKMAKAGPVETEIEYMGGGSQTASFNIVDQLLRNGDLIESGGKVYRG